MKCPAALLWGCSSGRLPVLGVHDPSGPAQWYLLGGASFVVANLWDVTDKDIDKLSMNCMRALLGDGGLSSSSSSSSSNSTSQFPPRPPPTPASAPNPNPYLHSSLNALVSVSEALATSRDVCKLRYAVGSAPVMYGLPLPFSSN